MAKAKKVKEAKPRPNKYESSNVSVNGTFEDMIKASLKPKPKK
jgi:hypothetical protein